MEICKAPTLRLKALNKHRIIHIMYSEMENNINNENEKKMEKKKEKKRRKKKEACAERWTLFALRMKRKIREDLALGVGLLPCLSRK